MPASYFDETKKVEPKSSPCLNIAVKSSSSMGFEDEDQESHGAGLTVTIAAALSLFGIVFLIIVLHFYAKYLLRRQQTRRHHHDLLYRISTQIAPIDLSSAGSPSSGLDPLVIATLPKILYKQTDQFRQGEIVECSVCLGTIEEDATVRVLPNCRHVFHVDCVDMWFSSHSTCPVCRAVAEPRVQQGHGGLATQVQVQPTAPPVEDGDVPQDTNELEMVGCSGLRIASFHRMVIGREGSLRRNQNSDGSASAMEDTEKALN